MNDLLLPIILLFSVVMTCVVIWRFYPSYLCAAIAAGLFVIAMPFIGPSFDQTPHGHPDLRGAFLLNFGMPLLVVGSIVAGAGLFARTQQRFACAVVLVITLGILLCSVGLA